MSSWYSNWLFWALLAAVFAALTAVFAKVGVENVNSDFATFLRTLVVVVALAALLSATGQFESIHGLSTRSVVFIVLSGLATGASWLCYSRALKLGDVSRVAPIDKLSVVIVAMVSALTLGERLSTGGWLGVCLIGVGAGLVALT